MGFTLVAKTPVQGTWCCTARQINFIINREPEKRAAGYFAAEHGPSAWHGVLSGHDAHHVTTVRAGARCPAHRLSPPVSWSCVRPPSSGIGGAPLYLIDVRGRQVHLRIHPLISLDGVDHHPAVATPACADRPSDAQRTAAA
jgi:4-hydroxyphenylpyruvate dioxygenase-like putative hemolysin